MSQRIYKPGVQNAPFGLLQANPEGSNYTQESAFSPTQTNLINKAIREAIFDAAPAQFNALKLVFSIDPIEVGSDEFEYLEHTFGRVPLIAASGIAAVAGVPNTIVTQSFDLDAASLEHVSSNLVITYADNTEGVIQSVTGATIVVGSRSGAGLSLVTTGDSFAIRSSIQGDATDEFQVFERLETITRFNFIQFFHRARRWGRVELQKFENMGTTDYLNEDKNAKLKQLRVDLFVSFFNGNRGEYQIANSEIAKSMGGIFPTMVAAGSQSANPTIAGLQTAFETLAFETNFKAEGATRFIFGTDELLNEFSKIYKQPGLRYEPNDVIANLQLNMIELGTQKWVLVPTELFREASAFPAEWKRRLLFLDVEAISPVKMAGIPAFEMGSTLDRKVDGTREWFKDWWCQAQLSLQFNNPLGSFFIDVQ